MKQPLGPVKLLKAFETHMANLPGCTCTWATALWSMLTDELKALGYGKPLAFYNRKIRMELEAVCGLDKPKKRKGKICS